jgi:large subunit ribosomal protein L21
VYAIIDSGGRQVRVEPGEIVHVYRRQEPAGESVTFDGVLFVASDDGAFVSGSPHIAGATVSGIVDSEAQGKKVRVFVKKRRKGMRKTIGHRTQLTRVLITGIETDG